MRNMLLIVLSIFLSACSSGPAKDPLPNKTPPPNVSKESFKKEKVLTQNEVTDFYSIPVKAQSPALQDETLDRYTVDEIEKLADSNDPLFEIALRCSKKDFNNAFATASKAFNRYQKIPAYWNLVANCHLNQGNNRKALLFYNKALEVSPGYVPALNNIGVLYARQGDDQKALVAFEKANKQSKFAKTPRYNLARLYLNYGLAESALPLFQGLLNESQNDADLINSVANCHFILSDYQNAAATFGRLPATFFRRADVGLNYALTLKKLGKASEAKKIYGNIDEPKGKELKEYYTNVGTQLGVQ